jgi:hypothetical protein
MRSYSQRRGKIFLLVEQAGWFDFKIQTTLINGADLSACHFLMTLSFIQRWEMGNELMEHRVHE